MWPHRTIFISIKWSNFSQIPIYKYILRSFFCNIILQILSAVEERRIFIYSLFSIFIYFPHSSGICPSFWVALNISTIHFLPRGSMNFIIPVSMGSFHNVACTCANVFFYKYDCKPFIVCENIVRNYNFCVDNILCKYNSSICNINLTGYKVDSCNRIFITGLWYFEYPGCKYWVVVNSYGKCYIKTFQISIS